MSAAMPALSLTPVSDEDGSREFDIPEESCEETVSDLLSLKSVLGTLTKEERTLIYLRFSRTKPKVKQRGCCIPRRYRYPVRNGRSLPPCGNN